MKELLSRARKRVIGHLVLDKGALALTIGLGGALVLLLAGTQILDWYWPALLVAVSLGVGTYQLRKTIPSVYVLAQRIDRKMHLADALSTAVYFAEHPKPGSESVCAVQFREADRLATGVVLAEAFPLTRPRYVVPAMALLMAVGALFVTRYLMTGSLDLRGSLIEMVVDNFFTTPAEELVAKANQPKAGQNSFDPSQPDAPPEDKQAQPPEDAEKGNELKSSEPSDSNSGEQGQEQGESDEEQGDSSQEGAPQEKQSDKQNQAGDEKGQSESPSQDQRSMLDKVRDAVNNLMAKMQSDPSKNKAQKGGEKQQAKQNQQAKDKGEKSEGDPESASDQQGDQGDPKDAKQSNAPGQKASEDAKSGAGQDDGKKDIEKAKELEAMGKVSELLAERSAAVSGDMLVEVGSTSQQLRTALTQQKAGHTDAGGEIHRDQVPLAYQTFVDRYFQEVRKGQGKGAAKGR